MNKLLSAAYIFLLTTITILAFIPVPLLLIPRIDIPVPPEEFKYTDYPSEPVKPAILELPVGAISVQSSEYVSALNDYKTKSEEFKREYQDVLNKDNVRRKDYRENLVQYEKVKKNYDKNILPKYQSNALINVIILFAVISVIGLFLFKFVPEVALGLLFAGPLIIIFAVSNLSDGPISRERYQIIQAAVIFGAWLLVALIGAWKFRVKNPKVLPDLNKEF